LPNPLQAERARKFGSGPRVLILEPTRETPRAQGGDGLPGFFAVHQIAARAVVLRRRRFTANRWDAFGRRGTDIIIRHAPGRLPSTIWERGTCRLDKGQIYLVPRRSRPHCWDMGFLPDVRAGHRGQMVRARPANTSAFFFFFSANDSRARSRRSIKWAMRKSADG